MNRQQTKKRKWRIEQEKLCQQLQAVTSDCLPSALIIYGPELEQSSQLALAVATTAAAISPPGTDHVGGGEGGCGMGGLLKNKMSTGTNK